MKEATQTMASTLSISTGQHSQAGRKTVNQDFHGLLVPDNHQLVTKGVAVALADGISSSNVSQIASESAVAGFLTDYYSTPDSWSVKQSAQRVLRATNAWLHAQTRQSQYRYDRDRGYVCTLSVMVLKSATAHLFHVGDCRIYRVHPNRLEQLTSDHRLWLSPEQSCLTRAIGIGHQLDIDYHQIGIVPGDTFLLTTDGVHEHLEDRTMAATIRAAGDDLDKAAQALVAQALENGSDDNLTAQVIRVDSVASDTDNAELFRELSERPFADELRPGQRLDGYQILRQIHASSRSHVYLAQDEDSGARVVLKLPSMEQRHDPAYLEQFSTEQWIARRINNPHVVRPFEPDRRGTVLYQATRFVDGCTLRQWMLDNPKPALETVRSLVEQIARGLRAFHRLEMVHQDLKPENIMVDTHGTVTLIDFGATRVAGLEEAAPSIKGGPRGAALYSAPETLFGEPATWLADQFSLGVISYQLLTGNLPYGAEIPKARGTNDLKRLSYRPARQLRDDVPGWVDHAIARAVHLQPYKRYPALSEYLTELRRPGQDWQQRQQQPLMERQPVVFWQSVSAILLLVLLTVLAIR